MARIKTPVYSFDFETVIDTEETRVWLWGAVNINNEYFEYGTSIDTFMDNFSKINCKGYFHNLKFDIQFIFYWLFHNGYRHTSDRRPPPGTFKTLISDMGVFYSAEICFYSGCKMTLYDSWRVIPMAVNEMPEAFGLDIYKLELDYKANRDINHVPTKEEIDYLHHDCLIVSRALNAMHAQGMTKMTAASNALHKFKSGFTKEEWNRLFPQVPLSVDKDCRKAYKGGWTFLNNDYKDKLLRTGKVYDVNSMYPWAMSNTLLPWGLPVWYDGEPDLNDKVFPLFIQCMRCRFKLKSKMYPSIQIKGSFRFVDTEYLVDSGEEVVTLYITSVDYKLITDTYDLYDVEYVGGYKFRAIKGIFKEYVDYWYEQKNKAKHEENWPIYYIAKLMLNSLYGKFGSNPEKRSKYPYLDLEKDIVKYEMGAIEVTETAYVPIAAFITSYCRDKIIRTAIKCGDRFVYADTDSVHIIGDDTPDIDIDDYRLGAFKEESSFEIAKFHRAKCYIEQINGKLQKKCAGLPKEAKENFNFDTMAVGQSFEGKLVPKNIKGGTVLVDRIFTIK